MPTDVALITRVYFSEVIIRFGIVIKIPSFDGWETSLLLILPLGKMLAAGIWGVTF